MLKLNILTPKGTLAAKHAYWPDQVWWPRRRNEQKTKKETYCGNLALGPDHTPTSSDINLIWHLGSSPRAVLNFKFRENRLRGLGDPLAKNRRYYYFWRVAYTTAYTTVQAVISACKRPSVVMSE